MAPTTPLDDDSLRRQLGQLLVVGFNGLTASEDIKTLIRAPYYVGAIILFQRNIESAEQVIALTNELQQVAREAGHERPLFIGIDQENGIVTRIKPPVAARLPGAMSLGATGSLDDTIRVSKATAELLAALGINMNYAPCCDVNSEPSNPVIGVRSPGDDGEFVGKVSSAIAQGMRESNVIPCVKHFPGHGDTNVDSHYGLPVISKSKEALDSCELVPFRRSAAEKIEAVMTAHIVMPSLDNSQLPATLSERALGLLRKELQYDGLVITDCLEMDAIRSGVGTEKGAAMAVAAGADCAMICHTFKVQVGAIEELYNASKSGDILLEQIVQSAARVDALKDKFLTWNSSLKARQASFVDALKSKHEELASEVYNRSVTVVRDEQKLLPLKPKPRLVYAYFYQKPRLTGAAGSGEESPLKSKTLSEFGDILREHNQDTVDCPLDQNSDLDEASMSKVLEADAVILATCNARLAPAQTETALKLAKSAKNLVVVATCDPYDFMDNPEVKTLLATYEPTSEAFRSLTRILFGDRQASGVLPVLGKKSYPVVEDFDPERDMSHVVALWHRLIPEYAIPADRLRTLLNSPNSKHFTTHSDGKLTGFVATYLSKDGEKTYISAILVDPDFQGTGIGTALISHARKRLRGAAKTSTITVGSSFPRFWPGVPLDIPERAISFFIHRGFRPVPGASSRDYTADLSTYQPPAGVLERAAKCGITYKPLTEDLYEECIANQREIFGYDPVWVGAYESLAQAGEYPQAMIALDETGKQVGWTLMQESGVGLANNLALMPLVGKKTGQIGCVGVHPDARNKGVGLALIANAALDLKRRGFTDVFIDWVDHVNWYERAGFYVWREYRQMLLTELS